MNDVIFETERLILRTFKEDDLDRFVEYRNNKEWMIHQSFKDKTKDEYRTVLLTPFYIEKGCQLAIALRSTGELIGDIYIEKSVCEFFIGYTIHPRFSRKGYGYEMVDGYINHLFKKYNGYKVIAETDIDNVSSIKLLEKIGFTQTMKNDEGFVFEILDHTDKENLL